MTLSHAAGNAGTHSLADRASDCYQTPPQATEALLRAEPLLQRPRQILEPAAGYGAIVDVARAAGHTVIATDLHDYKIPGQIPGRDFLLEPRVPDGVDLIWTNPPFKLAQEFVAHALDLCPHVIMLARLAFLESERRRPILDTGTLARIYVFRNRLPMMHRDGWAGPRASSATAFCWLVWERDHRGPAEFHRISWKEDPAARARAAGSGSDDKTRTTSPIGVLDAISHT